MRKFSLHSTFRHCKCAKNRTKCVKSKLSEEKRKNSEQQQYIQDLKSKLNHLESVKSERDQCKQEIENIRKQKEESAPLIDVQEYEQQIQKLQHSLEEEKKCVKLVHELFALRCSEFSDEKQSLENKKQALEKEMADLCSKQLCSNNPPLAEAVRWWKVFRRVMRPTCAGCAGICERKVPGRCRCRVDPICMRRFRGR
ncbi:Hypothetical predicted protein [Mytilus galloprovincialis]|uniref:Uncharacterized protein n=1 Tax=Mytilus galloprovincialis TaxID=29158 RepID=A0A8B6FUU2_MYTGA|nr:Hypothetical predicted protein [Mytilus galloprovincialis]